MAKLKEVALSSDAFFPFRDNIDRAHQVSGDLKVCTWEVPRGG